MDLWLACFTFDWPTKWNGTCQMVVEAVDPDHAMRKCHEKFARLANATDLFEPGTKVYTHGVVRLSGSFSEAVLVNWDTTKGDGRIFNFLPDPDDGGVVAFTMEVAAGETVEPFIEFYGDGDESGQGLMS